MTTTLRRRGVPNRDLFTGQAGTMRLPDFLRDSDIACRDVDTELFFPTSMLNDEKVKAARSVCNRCPVRERCAEWGIESGDDWAVLGALTPAERRKIRRQRANAAVLGSGGGR